MDLEIDYYELAGDALDALGTVGDYVEAESDLDPKLVELVKLRASQINGCAHCTEVHSERLRELGEEDRRIDTLAAWRESMHFTDRERAALAWTDAVTRIPDGVPEEVHLDAQAAFSDGELVDLTLVVGTMNVYNRLAICFREPVPGRTDGW